VSTSIRELDISELSISQRIQIAQDLLDSVLFETQGEFFTPEQLGEIDRRVAASDAGQIVGEPWDTIYSQLIKQ
jgi:putative addiction module component (TIGR02574 family)